jgi:hypothetical protein
LSVHAHQDSENRPQILRIDALAFRFSDIVRAPVRMRRV